MENNEKKRKVHGIQKGADRAKRSSFAVPISSCNFRNLERLARVTGLSSADYLGQLLEVALIEERNYPPISLRSMSSQKRTFKLPARIVKSLRKQYTTTDAIGSLVAGLIQRAAERRGLEPLPE